MAELEASAMKYRCPFCNSNETTGLRTYLCGTKPDATTGNLIQSTHCKLKEMQVSDEIDRRRRARHFWHED